MGSQNSLPFNLKSMALWEEDKRRMEIGLEKGNHSYCTQEMGGGEGWWHFNCNHRKPQVPAVPLISAFLYDTRPRAALNRSRSPAQLFLPSFPAAQSEWVHCSWTLGRLHTAHSAVFLLPVRIFKMKPSSGRGWMEMALRETRVPEKKI